jgi:hypothetical protein
VRGQKESAQCNETVDAARIEANESKRRPHLDKGKGPAVDLDDSLSCLAVADRHLLRRQNNARDKYSEAYDGMESANLTAFFFLPKH